MTQETSKVYRATNVSIISGTIFSDSFKVKTKNNGDDISSADGKKLYSIRIAQSDNKVHADGKKEYINQQNVFVDIWMKPEEVEQFLAINLKKVGDMELARVLAFYSLEIKKTGEGKEAKYFETKRCYAIVGDTSTQARYWLERTIKDLTYLLGKTEPADEKTVTEATESKVEASNEDNDLPF